MKILKLCLLLTLSALVVRAEPTTEKRQEIERMLRLTGMTGLMNQMKGQMIASFRGSMPQVPGEFWTKFEAKLDMNQLLERMVPIYDKYYTLDDLKAVNTFYESAAGQRFLAVTPQAMQEGMKVGEAWGREVAEQAAREAAAEAPPPAAPTK